MHGLWRHVAGWMDWAGGVYGGGDGKSPRGGLIVHSLELHERYMTSNCCRDHLFRTLLSYNMQWVSYLKVPPITMLTVYNFERKLHWKDSQSLLISLSSHHFMSQLDMTQIKRMRLTFGIRDSWIVYLLMLSS